MNYLEVKNQVTGKWQKVATLAATGAVMALASLPAHAAGAIDSLFDAVDLSGVQTKVLAVAVLIVGIAFVIKGPSIVKRLISKI